MILVKSPGNLESLQSFLIASRLHWVEVSAGETGTLWAPSWELMGHRDQPVDCVKSLVWPSTVRMFSSQSMLFRELMLLEQYATDKHYGKLWFMDGSCPLYSQQHKGYVKLMSITGDHSRWVLSNLGARQALCLAGKWEERKILLFCLICSCSAFFQQHCGE